jgi:hypothetical protein
VGLQPAKAADAGGWRKSAAAPVGGLSGRSAQRGSLTGLGGRCLLARLCHELRPAFSCLPFGGRA